MRKQLIELGQEPPPMSECPADISDFPSIVHTAFDIFNQLSDVYIPRFEGQPYYSGKNLSSLPLMFELHFIESESDKLLVIDLIHVLDNVAKKELNRKK